RKPARNAAWPGLEVEANGQQRSFPIHGALPRAIEVDRLGAHAAGKSQSGRHKKDFSRPRVVHVKKLVGSAPPRWQNQAQQQRSAQTPRVSQPANKPKTTRADKERPKISAQAHFATLLKHKGEDGRRSKLPKPEQSRRLGRRLRQTPSRFQPPRHHS